METIAELLAQGWKWQRAGEIVRAEQVARQVLQRDADNGEAQHLLGICLHRRGRLDQAVEQYEKALFKHPDRANLGNDLGTARAMQGRLDDAIIAFERELQNNPGSAEAHGNLANALRLQDRLPEAIAHFEEALRLRPTFAEGHHNLGLALLALGQRERAIACFHEALALKPNYSAAQAALQQASAGEDISDDKTALPRLSPPRKGSVYNFTVHKSWGITDPDRFKTLMTEATGLVDGGWYLGDNLFTWMRNNSALEDLVFMRAWRSNIVNPADEAIAWRRYILCCAAYHAVQLEGDFAECGVLFGTGVKTVIDYFGKDRFAKPFWAFDRFDTNFEAVKKRFIGYDKVHLIQGVLPEALNGHTPERIAYLHIDLNDTAPEIGVLDRFFDRVVPGGIVILDDYEWSGRYREQKITEDVWFEERHYRVFPLPTGQGLVLKR
jgi:tetratricopeptide (TPR) repeat protein